MTRRDDPAAEHDAYLRSALQHAPDAALAPSEALNQAILARARSATAASLAPSVPDEAVQAAERAHRHAASDGSPRRWRLIANLWAWFGQPAVATGFAGLMVATLVGVMWWDRPLEEALPQPEARPTARATDRTGPSGTRDAATAEPQRSATGDGTASAPPLPAAATPVAKTVETGSPKTSAVPAPSVERAPSAVPAPLPEPARSAERRSSPVPAPSTERSPLPAPRSPATSGADTAASMQGPDAFPSLRDRSVELSKNARGPADDAIAPAAKREAHSGGPPVAAAAPFGRSAPERGDARRGAAAEDLAATQAPATAAPRESASDGTPEATATPPSADRRTAALSSGSLAARAPAAPAEPGHPSPRPDAAGRVAERSSVERREMPSLDATPRERLALNGLAKSARAPARSSPLPALRAALVAEPGRWTWTTDDGSVRPATAELQRWLARLDAAATASADATASAIEAPAGPNDVPSADRPLPVRTITLLRDGQRHTSLRVADGIEATALHSPGGLWQARLAARDAAALRASVPER